MEAFGPYAEPAAIDFDTLSDEGLFLIHGSTGAGKTFLLDALCFALYGEVSGDRNVKTLKSHHSPAAAVPRVSLEFSCAGGRYRVERSPAHTAPKARGDGVTEKAAQAVLFRCNGAEALPIASRSQEVTREVEHLVGLDAAQFRQVILLPQGQFAEVLRARAEEREALLKTLFNTVIYEQAGLWLEERAKAARVELAERQRAQEVLCRQALQVWSPFAPEPEPEPDLEPELESLPAGIAAVVIAAAEQLQQATATLQEALQAKGEVERLADRWDRRAAAAARLGELEAKAPVVDDYRQRLRRAEQAEALRPSVETQLAVHRERQQLQERIEAQLAQASQARAAAQALPAALQRLDLTALPSREALDGVRQALAARRVELGALVAKAQEAAEAQAQADQADRQARQAEAEQARSRAALEAQQHQCQDVRVALQRACSARDQLDGLQQAAQAARARSQASQAAAAAQET
ncbi:MAG: AAA family ATPase, partial [Cyanobacteriota bacterium]|nr:AAA family ATPase [Cyanobacteriota bacterium]